MIADWFKYSSAKSFGSSTAKKQMLHGIECIIEYMEEMSKK